MRSSTTRALCATTAIVVAMTLVGSCSGVDGNGSDDEGAEGADLRENINLTLSGEAGEPGGRISYGLAAETDGWNPTINRWAPSGLMVARALFDTLAAYDEDLDWQPNLAEDFVPNDDYTIWTIQLRPDVQFHNGKPVDSEAVAAVLTYLKEATLTAQTFAPVASITPSGPLEVTLDMEQPWVNFPFAMTTQIGVIPDPEWLNGGEADQPVGTGPFEIASWQRDSQLVVTRNENYWRGEGLPYLEEVEFRPITDAGTRANAFTQGQLDAMIINDGQQIANFKERAGEGEVQMVNDPAGETSELMVMLNTATEPFDNPDARRALALATDRDSVIALLGQGQYEPAAGPFSPSSPWYVETDYPSFDLAAASDLAQQVRDEGDGTFEFNLTIVATPETANMADVLVQQWAGAGIDVGVEQIESAEFIGNVVVGNYQATIWQQFDSPHPLGDSIWWHPEAVAEPGMIGLNFARNDNPAIGDALDAARQTTDDAEELGYYQEVQRLLAEDIPYVWLYHTQYSVVAKPELVNIVNYDLPNGTTGVELHGGSHPLWQVWLER